MMTDDEKRERARQLMEEERRTAPLGWWYLSYAGEQDFNGGVLVMAHGFAGAAFESARRGLSPGGQVRGLPVPNDHMPPAKYRNRLLTLVELREFWDMASIGELEKERLQDDGEPA
jgi:hypothetical protein